jgi:hypothetical protein
MRLAAAFTIDTAFLHGGESSGTGDHTQRGAGHIGRSRRPNAGDDNRRKQKSMHCILLHLYTSLAYYCSRLIELQLFL